MTLSICIPIYNYNVTKLINDLSQQALKEEIKHEIILIDDNSDVYEKENAQLATLPYTQLTRLPQNIGRSAIRNQLAKKAQFEYILFMDCDAEVVDDFFIKRYIVSAQSSHADIIMGGCCYKKEQPASDYYLRWLYGIQREEKSAEKRNTAPYRSFTAFNCLIKKKLFDTIQFDETLRKYGHEDTLFGWELKQQNCNLIHIDNPAYHLSYDDTNSFIKKTESSISNLWCIYQKTNHKKEFRKDIKILRYQHILKWTFLLRPYIWFFNLQKNRFISNLTSNQPDLRIFDLYKLGILCKTSIQKD